VEGPVVGTYYDETAFEGTIDDDTFLDIGKMHPETGGVSVWIQSLNRSKFSEPNQIIEEKIIAVAVEEPVKELETEDAIEEETEEYEPAGDMVEEEEKDTAPQGPSKGAYLGNVQNIINEYELLINHWNTFYQDYDDLDSILAFGKSVLNKLGEINNILKNITPAAGYQDEQIHFIDLANMMYHYQQQQINYLKDRNIDGCNTMIDNFNNTYHEFRNYYNSL